MKKHEILALLIVVGSLIYVPIDICSGRPQTCFAMGYKLLFAIDDLEVVSVVRLAIQCAIAMIVAGYVIVLGQRK